MEVLVINFGDKSVRVIIETEEIDAKTVLGIAYDNYGKTLTETEWQEFLADLLDLKGVYRYVESVVTIDKI